MKDILSELNDKDYIEKLNEFYDIHFCEEKEIGDLVLFIDKYWRKDHIFVLSRKLLDWQHYDAINRRYNFVIAKNRKTGEIHSMLGFVPTYQFDSFIKDVEVWPCIWKSRDDINIKGLGVSLYYYLKTHIDIETISIMGISEIALSIYKHWNFSTGRIEQYYLPNMQVDEILSCGKQKNNGEKRNEDGWHIKEISEQEYKNIDPLADMFQKISKYKSKEYYVNRYFNHPIYKYVFYAINRDNEPCAIMVTRECGNKSSKCIRVVDFIGAVQYLINVRNDLAEMLEQKKYEYMDFTVVGIPSKLLETAGFVDRRNNPVTIIPQYFEPFRKENIDLDYAFKTTNPEVGILFFKADADQDRPNMLPQN